MMERELDDVCAKDQWRINSKTKNEETVTSDPSPQLGKTEPDERPGTA